VGAFFGFTNNFVDCEAGHHGLPFERRVAGRNYLAALVLRGLGKEAHLC
jgi:hypothetical protein